MSLAKVHTKTARKDYICEVGQEPIHPGDQYMWFKVGFRSRFKHIRCMKHPPKTSDRESSNLAQVYEAQETALAELSAIENQEDHDIDHISTILSDYASAVREVADQYREADDNFGGTGSTQSGERADILESAADELENFSSVDHNVHEDEEGNDDETNCNWSELIEDARDAIEQTELP